jgi:FtsZ-binding cell division protein ZapB
MSVSKPTVYGRDNTFFSNSTDSSTKIEVGSEQWYDWLQQLPNKSFSYESGLLGNFTARKETRATSQNEYWSAYKRSHGKLRKVYLGLSQELTAQKLAAVCKEINQSQEDFWLSRQSYLVAKQQKNYVTDAGLGSELPNNKTATDCVTIDETQKSYPVQVTQFEIKELKQKNAELTQQLEQLEQERDQLRSQLEQTASQRTDLRELEQGRDRFLASLRLGKQAPEYKRTKSVLDRFIAFISQV